ncbi:MAG: metal/formaldehyde-sensitive transcriptional repressor [Pseudomonadota bacterium]
MAHTVKHKKSLLTRIRRIKGQANALEGALDSEAECGDILQQIAAIRGAVNGLMMEVLDGHLREHLGSEAISATQRENDIDQVVSIFRSYLK